MSGFGDAEPEDAWHPDDAPDLLIDNLERRIALLDGDEPESPGGRFLRLAVVARRLAQWRQQRAEPTVAEQIRAQLLVADLVHVLGRLAP